ncbi:MAG: response regulator receiver protein [Myxococcales bacterium]|nr:response regulator receiver protein [Myxococcales bacterium]
MMAVRRKQILIVDDSALVLDMMRAALDAAGYEVLIANNLTQLEEHRSRNRPDLVLMDVQMPEAFGDDVAMVLRAAREVDAPIYLLSTLDDAELKRRAADADIDGFISKQMGAEAIVLRVQQIIGAGGEPS